MVSAHKFPDWAPKRLIEEFYRLQKKIDQYRQFDLESKNEISDSDNKCMECGINSWKRAADKEEKLIIILYRLLTDNEMEHVWITLQRAVVVPNPWKNEPEYQLWYHITRALNDFSFLSFAAKTPSQRSKNLKTVVEKTKNLQKAINSDKAIKIIAQKLMATYLALQNLSYRCDYGDTPSLTWSTRSGHSS